MSLRLGVVACGLICAVCSYSQSPPTVQWQKAYGGTLNDLASYGLQTSDGGYIVVGSTQSNDGDISGNHGSWDWWVIKTDQTGSTQWKKTLGGSGMDFCSFIQQTTDGGYILSGSVGSNDGDVSGNHGSTDFWVVKLDSAGNIQWSKCYGGTSLEGEARIRQTSDGGYILAGGSMSNNGDISGNHGLSDYCVIKLSPAGAVEWQRSYGGSNNEDAYFIRSTPDGGYVLTGHTKSTDGEVTGHHGDYDYWVIKITSTGTLQWQKALGGSGSDGSTAINLTNDGGYIVTGSTRSTNGNVTGNHGDEDAWVVKLDQNGNLTWQKCFGGPSTDVGTDIFQTSDGHYIMGCYALSNSGDITGNNGLTDYWLVKLDQNGALVWQKTYGGSQNDLALGVQGTSDNGYVLFGYSASNNANPTNPHGDDFWVVKLNAAIITGIPDPGILKDISIHSNPTSTGILLVSNPRQTKAIYTVFSADGRQLHEEKSLGSSINLSLYPRGVYLVQIKYKKDILSIKVIRQ